MPDIGDHISQILDGVKPVTIDEVRRVSKRRHRRRGVTATSVVAVLAMAIIAVTAEGRNRSTQVSVGGTPPTIAPLAPLADPSLTPRGWSPVGIGPIQISVPSAWFPEDFPSPFCGIQPMGVILINTPDPSAHCQRPPNVVAIRTATTTRLENARSMVVNHIPVIEGNITGRSARVLRALGMEVEASGPLAAQVLATLTHSPLSAVLSPLQEAVPADWQPVTFDGLQFAVPADWRIDHTDTTGGCPNNITPNVLVLSQRTLAPSCLAVLPTVGTLAPQPGMVLSVGPSVRAVPTGADCITRKSLRICIDPTPPSGGGRIPGRAVNLLTAQITVPGQTAKAEIEIGLTGSGLMAKEIFDSLTSTFNAGGSPGTTSPLPTPEAPSPTPTVSTVTVPALTGRTQAGAIAALNSAGLAAVPQGKPSASVPPGVVLGESPGAGAAVSRNTAIMIFVSSGPPGPGNTTSTPVASSTTVTSTTTPR